jgi:hypothetical protein
LFRADTPSIVRPAQVFNEGPGGTKSYSLYSAINQRLSRDITTLREKILASTIEDAVRNDLMNRFHDLTAMQDSLPITPTVGFKAVLQIHTLEDWPWKVPKDRSGADKIRIKVLRKLTALQKPAP